jgi:hypothetical protein
VFQVRSQRWREVRVSSVSAKSSGTIPKANTMGEGRIALRIFVYVLEAYARPQVG